jgi:hypothetical protein
MKSRPTSEAAGSVVILISSSESGDVLPNPPAARKALVMHSSCYTPPRLWHAPFVRNLLPS